MDQTMPDEGQSRPDQPGSHPIEAVRSRRMITPWMLVVGLAVLVAVGIVEYSGRLPREPSRPDRYAGPSEVIVGDRLLIIDARAFVADDPATLAAFEKAVDEEDREAMRAIIARGNGFRSVIGDQVEILDTAGELVKVVILPGSSRKGRSGYTRRAWIGKMPQATSILPEAIAKIPVQTREDVYNELKRLETLAQYEAGHRFPDPSDPKSETSLQRMKRLVERQEFFKAEKEKNLVEAAAMFKITPVQAELIANEGFEKSWPHPDVPNPYGPKAGLPEPPLNGSLPRTRRFP